MTDTTDHKIKVYGPSAEYRFFLYCPNDGHTFYRTQEERDTAAQKLIREYLDCGEWSEEVVGIYAGKVTHRVVQVERLERVGQLDDDGYDENGEYWEDDDVECKCDYGLRPLAQPAPAEPVDIDLGDLLARIRSRILPHLRPPANHIRAATEMVSPPAEGEVE